MTTPHIEAVVSAITGTGNSPPPRGAPLEGSFRDQFDVHAKPPVPLVTPQGSPPAEIAYEKPQPDAEHEEASPSDAAPVTDQPPQQPTENPPTSKAQDADVSDVQGEQGGKVEAFVDAESKGQLAAVDATKSDQVSAAFNKNEATAGPHSPDKSQNPPAEVGPAKLPLAGDDEVAPLEVAPADHEASVGRAAELPPPDGSSAGEAAAVVSSAKVTAKSAEESSAGKSKRSAEGSTPEASQPGSGRQPAAAANAEGQTRQGEGRNEKRHHDAQTAQRGPSSPASSAAQAEPAAVGESTVDTTTAATRSEAALEAEDAKALTSPSKEPSTTKSAASPSAAPDASPADSGAASSDRLVTLLHKSQPAEARHHPPLTEAQQTRLVQRVAKAFGVAQQRGETTIRLRLSPPELGSLRLEVKFEGGALAARLEVETAAARDALVDNLGALRQRLAEQNIRVDQFDVDLMDRRRDDLGGEDRQGWAPSNEQRRERSAAERRTDESEAAARDERSATRSINWEETNIDVVI